MNNEYIGGMKRTFGVMFDYAVNHCNIDGDSFWNMMVCSGIAMQIECTNPKYVAGKSGIELARDIAEEINYSLTEDNKPIATEQRSADYWCGWALIQYQNYSGLNFKQIHRLISYNDLIQMYPKYHEMDIKHLYDSIDELKSGSGTKLKAKRELSGMSQSELARISGTNLRTLQAYEQGVKDINKAAAGAVKQIADTLECDIDEII